MRLLKRSLPPRPYDAHLTYFTVSQANDFRRLVDRSFAAAGHDVSVYGEHIEDRDGTTLGLWNIGMLCASARPDDWSELIAEHVTLVTTPPRRLAELTEDELQSGLYLRLLETGSVADPDDVAYARVVAPGLLEVLSVDLADAVVTPSREEMAEHGALGELIERGRANLRALLDADEPRAEVVGEGAPGWFASVRDDSFFTASLALVLPDTVRRFTGKDHGALGTLVAVPARHRLMVRPVDAPDAGNALQQMFLTARREHRDAPGALSPNVFWVRNGRWVPVTAVEGRKARVVPGELRDALKSL